jgi:hypothetical protein
MRERSTQLGPPQADLSASTEILVQVDPEVTSGDLSPQIHMPEEFAQRAREVAASIANIAGNLRANLETLMKPSGDSDWSVDSFDIGFSLALQAESGIVITKASAGATFSVKLTLKHSDH